jgi:hypothetical protein
MSISEDTIDGLQCSWCGVCFEEEHGYPVLCDNCFEDQTESILKKESTHSDYIPKHIYEELQNKSFNSGSVEGDL